MPKSKSKKIRLNTIIQISDADEIDQIMYNSIEDLVLFLDTLGRIVNINRAGIAFSGFTEDEIIGRFFITIPGVFSKEYVKDYLSVFRKTLQGKSTKSFQGKLNDKHRKTHIMQFSTYPVKNKGKVRYIMVIGHDITKEEQIAHSLKHSTKIIDTSSDFILSLNPELTILTWNSAAEKLSGYTRQELIGKNLNDIALIKNVNALKNWCDQRKNSQVPQYYDAILITKQMEHKLLRLSCSTIDKNQTDVEGLIFVGNEVVYQSKKHGKIIPGNSYLLLNQDAQEAIDLFSTLVLHDTKGLVISRGNIERYIGLSRQLDIQIITLGSTKDKRIPSIETLNDLITTVTAFITRHNRPILIIDRIDFLIIQVSFEEIIQAFYQINTLVTSFQAILLLRLNPALLEPQQLAILKEEFNSLPEQEIVTIDLSDNLYKILQYIDQQNEKHINVSFSKIQKALGISKATTTKRIHQLEARGLIEIHKKGKMKQVYISTNGHALITNRK